MESTSSPSLQATVFTFVYISRFLLHVLFYKPKQSRDKGFPKMASSKRLFGVVRRNLLRRSPSTISSSVPETTRQHIAAIKIQAFFRGHLARRAFRALKSLVKLQAVARGVLVRRQARIALHCMHALARLQVRVRARQILSQ
ncbi:Protein IQ-DOMAIN 20 [Hirschfeldia incana]|nr:Protein IQ-DOMAIN 20 [Hirschfeldia incana]